MTKPDLEVFLLKNRIDRDLWEASGLSWDTLASIGDDFERQVPHLEAAATLLANIIQRFPAVHSVRWRVKDQDHLLAKIIRKCAEGNEKYKIISSENYGEIITDLIGIRALHLFKSDFIGINESILRSFVLKDKPVVYVREGDDAQFCQQCSDIGFEVKPHPKGYRSIHYVITTQPLKHRIHLELQVRTIFEEGWSEIDHMVRYPNYSDDVQLAYLLTIFNRMAGSADEMGGFVRVLADQLNETKNQLEDATREKDESLAKAEAALEQLATVKNGAPNDQIVTLQRELKNIKAASHPATSGNSYNAVTLFSISSELASRLKAAVDSIDDPVGVKAAMKAIKDPGGIKAAIDAIDDPGGVKAAMKAIKDPGGIKAAIDAIDDPGGVKATIKAIEDPGGIRAAMDAINDPGGVKAAIRSIKGTGDPT